MRRLLALLFLLASGAAAQTPDAPPPPPPPEPEPMEPLIYEVVEVAPRLVGGLEGLQRRVKYPELAVRANIEGKVFVQFVVDEKGEVTDAQAVRCPNELLCDAALEAVEASRFEPGLQRGRPVKVRFTLPVDFKLLGPEDEPTTEAAFIRLLGQEWGPEAYREVGRPTSGVIKNGSGALVFGDVDPDIERVVLFVEDRIVHALEVYLVGPDIEADLRRLRQRMTADMGPPDADGFFSPEQTGEPVRARVDPDAGRMRLEHAPLTGEGEIETVDAPPAPPAPPVQTEDGPGVVNEIEKPPVLIGGLDGLQRRVVYPPEAVEAGLEGRVFVEFVVDETGAVTNAVCLRFVDTPLCPAALAAVEASRFEPGLQDGEPVKVRFTVPVIFRLI